MLRSIVRPLSLIVISALMVAGPIGWVAARSVQAQSGELLVNAGFDDPFVQEGSANIFVANGWQAWYVTPDEATYPSKCSGSDATCKPYAVPVYHPSQPQNSRVPPRALAGNSQQWGATYAVFVAGVYQQVGNITPGTQLRFSAYTQGFNCDDDRGCFGPADRYGLSYEPGDMQMRVGIDPAGGTNPFAPSVVWSSFANPLDAFVPQQVEAVAQGSQVTVFVWSSPTYPEKHTEVYVDSASLVALGQGTLAPTSAAPTSSAQTPAATPTAGTAAPTATISPDTKTYTVVGGDTLSAIAQRFNLTLDQLLALNPTLTRESVINVGQVVNVAGTPAAVTATVPPTATPQPSPTLAATPTPAAATPTAAPTTTASITSTTVITTPEPTATPAVVALNSGLCLQAFNDANDNLSRDSNEALVAGVVFNIKSANGQTTESYTTDGKQEPHCFTTLPDGRYTVTAQLPAHLSATTDSSWDMSLLAGTNVNIVLGTQPDTTPTVQPTAGPIAAPTTAAAAATRSNNTTPLALLGGGVLLLLAGGVLIVGLRSRRK